MNYKKITVLCTLHAALICLSNIAANAQLPFTPVDTSTKGIMVLPEGMQYRLLFREGDSISLNGKKTVAKGELDLNIFIPFRGSSRNGMMYTSHEANDTNSVIGDGGGGTLYTIGTPMDGWVAYDKIDENLKSKGKYFAIDFSPVGGTYNNCSGALTPKGTIFTSEEFPPFSNKELYRNGAGFRDTSDFNGLKRYKNMGWVVEVDPNTGVALRKLYHMGRFSHEGAWPMADRKTVYMADDFFPSVFFKFVADKKDDYSKGQLYAYKQSGENQPGTWIALPMEMDSLVNIRNVAMRMGATVFARTEWITQANGKLYISETGTKKFKYDTCKVYKGELANHIKGKYEVGNGVYYYLHGSVMEFDPQKNTMRQLIAGGLGPKSSGKVFSNPDGISNCVMNGKKYLVINEDAISPSEGRWINEIWFLDLSIKNPEITDLQRFMIAPEGCETTGGYFTPDYKTYFVNIQHPAAKNAYPFNKSCTIAITGFQKGKKK